MQAENLEKEASSEYGTPESEAAGLRFRCNTGEFVAHSFVSCSISLKSRWQF